MSIRLIRGATAIIHSSVKTNPDVILASASPRREQLLRGMGVRFTVAVPENVEEIFGGGAPDIVAMQNAQRKARAVAGRHHDALVIGADTVVVLDGKIFGKPADDAGGAAMLAQLSGRMHVVITGVCIAHRELGTEITFAESTRVWMRPLTAGQIAEYIAKADVRGFAGAYAIQEHGDTIVERIQGSYSNVVGLPMERLAATLQKLGVAAPLRGAPTT
jgi:septum formation protein